MPDQKDLIAAAVRLARQKVFGNPATVFTNPESLGVRMMVGKDRKDHWLFHELLDRLEEHARTSGKPHVSGTNAAVGEFSAKEWALAEKSGFPDWLQGSTHKGALKAPEVIRKTRLAWQQSFKGQATFAEVDVPSESRAVRVRVTFEVGYRFGYGDVWLSALVQRYTGGQWQDLPSTTGATRHDRDVMLHSQTTDDGVIAKVLDLIRFAQERGDTRTAQDMRSYAETREWPVKFSFGFVAMLIVTAATAAVIHVYTRQLEGTTAGAAIDVVAAREDLAAHIIEHRTFMHVTPAMYWNGMSVFAEASCAGERAIVDVGWKNVRQEPPYVLTRNGRVYLDRLTQREFLFTDRNVLPGRSYTYALGKRDSSTGEIHVGWIGSAETPSICRAGNQEPSVMLFPDPPGGSAPLRVTFEAFYRDDHDARPPQFAWSFGDNTALTTQEPRVTHEFHYGGDYNITVEAPDSSGRLATASIRISVVGPPPPAETQLTNPYDLWIGSHAEATPIVGTLDDEFVIRMKEGRIQRRSFLPIAYRWIWDDCIERGRPGAPHGSAAANVDCASAPLREPIARRRFTEPGQYSASVEVTYETGEVDIITLGRVTVLPNEAWDRANPETRQVWDEYRQALKRPRRSF